MIPSLTIETINITDNWFCECNTPGCRQQINLPPDVAQMLLQDKGLVLIIDGCQRRQKGTMVKEGGGFKIYRIE